MARSSKIATETAPLAPDRLSELVHDIRHCLHVLRIGRELLTTVDDTEKRREICASMTLEEKQATALLEELVQIAREACPRKEEP